MRSLLKNRICDQVAREYLARFIVAGSEAAAEMAGANAQSIHDRRIGYSDSSNEVSTRSTIFCRSGPRIHQPDLRFMATGAAFLNDNSNPPRSPHRRQ